MQDPSSHHRPNTLKRESGEWRCECGKLLFKGAFIAGLLEVKCTRCKRMVYLQQFNTYTADHQSFMVTADTDGTILTGSKGVQEVLGYSEESVVGRNFLEFLDPSLYKAAAFWLEAIGQAEPSNNPYTSLILPLKTKDSKELILSLLIRPAHLGGRDIYVVIAEAGPESADSHDKKVLSKIAQKGRKQREGWDFIISPEGLITDASGKSKLGYEEADLKDLSFSDLLDAPSQELAGKLQKQESFILDLTLKTKLAGLKKYKVCFAPDFLAEPGKPAFIVAFRLQEAQQSASSVQTSAA